MLEAKVEAEARSSRPRPKLKPIKLNYNQKDHTNFYAFTNDSIFGLPVHASVRDHLLSSYT